MNAADIKVWDPLVRVFHWGLLGSCVLAYATQEEHYDLHLYAGYAVLGLVAFRVLWGLVGPRHARFSDFVYGPTALSGYLQGLMRRTAPRYLGHNPAGGAMVVVLLVTLLIITISGIALDAAENRAGPLAATRLFLYRDQVILLHDIATDVGVVLVVLHVLGVLHASIAHRENLVRAMLTGRKRPLDRAQ
ncbi:MAG: cytochrome b/b6 domain-containing protein [Chromatiaceae bacterium]|nr:cytochrome b/b6 domain-containing protein [Chromatiaceae bacterium]